MIGIDTNVLVRYLTQDDETQSNLASKLIDKHSVNKIFINDIVICELIWVLERGYKYSKIEIISVLRAICTTVEFIFEDHNILWLSISEYEKINADFSDILISRINTKNGCTKNYTFDKGAARSSGFDLIEE